jgi:Predicted integral membrane protein
MLDRLYIKAMAKEQIRGHIGMLLVCGLLMSLIVSVASALSWVVAPAFGISFILIFLRLTVGEGPEVSKIFDGFNVFGKALGLNLLTGLFTALWSMLLFFPGIMKAYAYSMPPIFWPTTPS